MHMSSFFHFELIHILIIYDFEWQEGHLILIKPYMVQTLQAEINNCMERLTNVIIFIF